MNKTEQLEQKIAALRQRYFSELPDKLNEINSLWHNMKASSDFTGRELERAFHKIAGSAGMYGADHLTAFSREVENYLSDHSGSFGDSEIAAVDDYLNRFATLVAELS